MDMTCCPSSYLAYLCSRSLLLYLALFKVTAIVPCTVQGYYYCTLHCSRLMHYCILSVLQSYCCSIFVLLAVTIHAIVSLHCSRLLLLYSGIVQEFCCCVFPGCPYGDRASWCRHIGKRYMMSSCYDHASYCCTSCMQYKRNDPGKSLPQTSHATNHTDVSDMFVILLKSLRRWHSLPINSRAGSENIAVRR